MLFSRRTVLRGKVCLDVHHRTPCEAPFGGLISAIGNCFFIKARHALQKLSCCLSRPGSNPDRCTNLTCCPGTLPIYAQSHACRRAYAAALSAVFALSFFGQRTLPQCIGCWPVHSSFRSQLSSGSFAARPPKPSGLCGRQSNLHQIRHNRSLKKRCLTRRSKALPGCEAAPAYQVAP
jgi:hypothetical protein